MSTDKEYKNFITKQSTFIEEIQVRIVLLEHRASGAEIVHVETDDDENLFGLCFKTYRNDSTGIAHILEHTVLCGSEKFPVKDPFFSMTRRSLHTFMNAFTAKLWTCYPASSRIEKDFYNLLDVYMDAVFYPKLNKESFLQEGIRFAFQNSKDINSKLLAHGIVYNEMKGAYSNPHALFWKHLIHAVCSDSIYGYDSGGDPEQILTMTHENLLAFHKRYYDPSNCTFFFYGNIPLEKHLDFIEKRVLSKAHKSAKIQPIASATRYKEPKRVFVQYPVQKEESENTTFLGLGWLTISGLSEQERLTLSLLDSLLMDTDASLLRKKILDSNLCRSAYSSYDPDTTDVPYMICLTGTDKKHMDALENLILATLKEISQSHISEEKIQGVLHQLAFSRLEISSTTEPYALQLFDRTLLPFLQGGSLTDGLRVHSLLEECEKNLKDPTYLQNFIEKMFLNNQHRVLLCMEGDPDYSEKIHKKEEDFLAKKKESLSLKDKETLVEQAACLEEYQNEEEVSLGCLPMLQIQDIPKKVPYFPLEKKNYKGLSIYHHGSFTNKIIYADLVFDLPQISEQELPYLHLFASLLTEIGSGKRNYTEQLDYLHRYVGGISTSLSLNVQKDNPEICHPTFSLSAKSLDKNHSYLFSIMKDCLLTPNFLDKDRLRQLIEKKSIYLQNALSSHAVRYALLESSSGFSSWNYVNHLLYGLPYYKFIQDLAKNLDARMDLLVDICEGFVKKIFHLNNPHLVLSCSQKAFDKLPENNFGDLTEIADSGAAFHPWVETPKAASIEDNAKEIETRVAHNTLALSTVSMNSHLAAPLKLANYLFENLHIHPEIREKGGAYTTGAKYNILTGDMHFYSSKDPHIYKSYKAFEEAICKIAEGKFSDQDLLEAKLCYIQDVDNVVAPEVKASLTYFQHKVGLTKDVRQEFRDQILHVNKQDVIEAVKMGILPKLEPAKRISYAHKALIIQENKSFEKNQKKTLKPMVIHN